ncbi:hypothetical protein [Maribacter arenosus]|nr:hypothetical protein [Maribacter arenosus]
MKVLIAILIFIHGSIHLFGFAKAFKLTQIEQFSTHISKLQGVFWFITFLMFAYTGEALLVENAFWPWTAFTAVLLSTRLIFTVWKDAKYGVIPNVIILLAALFHYLS